MYATLDDMSAIARSIESCDHYDRQDAAEAQARADALRVVSDQVDVLQTYADALGELSDLSTVTGWNAAGEYVVNGVAL